MDKALVLGVGNTRNNCSYPLCVAERVDNPPIGEVAGVSPLCVMPGVEAARRVLAGFNQSYPKFKLLNDKENPQ
jgi:hypothetical protein